MDDWSHGTKYSADNLKLVLDISISRRKNAFALVDPEGTIVCYAVKVAELIGWLYDRDVRAFPLQAPDTNYLITISKPPREGDPKNG